jgi:hypothetical protein
MRSQCVRKATNKFINGSNSFTGINPTMKFTWAEEHWERWCVEEARQAVRNAVSLPYCTYY